jgi:hypothetical protein
MNYYKKLLLSFVLLFICYIILYFLNRTSFSTNTSSSKEGMTSGNDSFNGCHSVWNNSLYGTYDFEKYYGRNSYKNGYSDKYYQYPVYDGSKNYKNFNSNAVNYDNVYDVSYKNTQTKGN